MDGLTFYAKVERHIQRKSSISRTPLEVVLRSSIQVDARISFNLDNEQRHE